MLKPLIQFAPPKYRVGDFVRFPYGACNIVAQIVEDRGPLARGQHMYRLRYKFGGEEVAHLELAEEDLQAVSSPNTDIVMDYFKNGGLADILRLNLGAKHDQRKVWLTYASNGDLTYTFAKERGVAGGVPVPYWALLENKAYSEKHDEVVTFLTNFGLTTKDAEEIIQHVGMVP